MTAKGPPPESAELLELRAAIAAMEKARHAHRQAYLDWMRAPVQEKSPHLVPLVRAQAAIERAEARVLTARMGLEAWRPRVPR